MAEDKAEGPAPAPRESSPARSGSTVLIPDVESQQVDFGAVDLSESEDAQQAQAPGEDEQARSDQEGSVQGSQGASELASPISPRAAPSAKVTAPPPVPVHAQSSPPPKAPSVLFKGPLKDLVNLADSASSVPQPVPRPAAVKSASQKAKAKAAVDFPSLPGAKPPSRTALDRSDRRNHGQRLKRTGNWPRHCRPRLHRLAVVQHRPVQLISPDQHRVLHLLLWSGRFSG